MNTFIMSDIDVSAELSLGINIPSTEASYKHAFKKFMDAVGSPVDIKGQLTDGKMLFTLI
jgi:hypothetical protein